MRIIITLSVRIDVSSRIHSDVNGVDFDVRDVELAAALDGHWFDEELDWGSVDGTGDGFDEGRVLHPVIEKLAWLVIILWYRPIWEQ